MRLVRGLLQHRLVRFLLVGFSNAALHFTVLNLTFYSLGLSKIGASLAATLCAVTYSFFLNKDFVFKNKAKGETLLSEAALFVLVTLSGMLIIHNLTYLGVVHLISGHDSSIISLLATTTGHRFSSDFVDINFATVCGALVAMFWNYNGYRMFVFKAKAMELSDGEA